MTRLAGTAWVLLLNFYVVQLVAQAGWTAPYDPARNAISDLGATTAPGHAAANLSWVASGLLMLLGGVLGRGAFPRTRAARAGLALVAVAGLAFAAVGLNPENTHRVPHVLAAAVTIVGGEAALIVLGAAVRRRWPALGLAGIVGGIAAVLGLLCLVAGVGGPARFGLFERVAAYPITLWLILCGARLLRARPDGVPP